MRFKYIPVVQCYPFGFIIAGNHFWDSDVLRDGVTLLSLRIREGSVCSELHTCISLVWGEDTAPVGTWTNSLWYLGLLQLVPSPVALHMKLDWYLFIYLYPARIVHIHIRKLFYFHEISVVWALLSSLRRRQLPSLTPLECQIFLLLHKVDPLSGVNYFLTLIKMYWKSRSSLNSSHFYLITCCNVKRYNHQIAVPRSIMHCHPIYWCTSDMSMLFHILSFPKEG